ncbi:hypothetical protein ACHAWF_016128 [Thalassiosira exigua]
MTPSSGKAPVGIAVVRAASASASVAEGPPSAGDSIPSASTTSRALRRESVDPSLDDADATADDVLHFCFIVHGHQGRPTDLSYLHEAAVAAAREGGAFGDARSSERCPVGRRRNRDAAARDDGNGKDARPRPRRRKRDRWPFLRGENGEGARHSDSSDGSDGGCGEVGSNTDDRNSEARPQSALVVHNIACNEGRTGDGIAKGGERLVDEMLEVIRLEVRRQQREKPQNTDAVQDGSCGETQPIDATISIVGNSLGGLYGRYAAARLGEVLAASAAEGSSSDESGGDLLLDDRVRVHLNVFCSTASPHLGCASHTYVPLPRAAELGVAKILGETGSDLFRLNDLVEEMATSPRFLAPLGSFRKRIAYANAYGTDFPVPGATACFLDGGSDYPHYFDDDRVGRTSSGEDNNINCPASEKGLIVARLRTPRSDGESRAKDETDALTAMSSSLDSLGWTKVFVDIRSELPVAVPLPPFLAMYESDCPVSRLKATSGEDGMVRSRDLARAVSATLSATPSGGRRIGLPLGHNAICAFSRGSVSGAVNSGGRPVMDGLAIDLTREISTWSRPE